MKKVRRFTYVTPHRRGMLHVAFGSTRAGGKLVCGRHMQAGWQFAMAHSGIQKCSQCQVSA